MLSALLCADFHENSVFNEICKQISTVINELPINRNIHNFRYNLKALFRKVRVIALSLLRGNRHNFVLWFVDISKKFAIRKTSLSTKKKEKIRFTRGSDTLYQILTISRSVDSSYWRRLSWMILVEMKTASFSIIKDFSKIRWTLIALNK